MLLLGVADVDIARRTENDIVADLFDIAVECVRRSADEVDDAVRNALLRLFKVEHNRLFLLQIDGHLLRIVKCLRLDHYDIHAICCDDIVDRRTACGSRRHRKLRKCREIRTCLARARCTCADLSNRSTLLLLVLLCLILRRNANELR